MIRHENQLERYVDRRLGGVVRYFLVPQPDIDMRVPDEILKCVVFFAVKVGPGDSGKWALAGTGFLMGVKPEGSRVTYLYLVTAKHVVTELGKGDYAIRVNTKDGKSIPLLATGAKWFYHPSDKSADVAVVPYPISDVVDVKTIPSEMILTDEILKKTKMGVGDEVFITGLFTQLYGDLKNLPIVRTGNVAMIPDEPVHTKYFGDMEAYLVEARSIGGLSGSPVFIIYHENALQWRFYLMGLMHGHWDILPGDKIDIPLEDAKTGASVNMGIAIVVPAKKIYDVLFCPELVEARRIMDEKLKLENPPTLDAKK